MTGVRPADLPAVRIATPGAVLRPGSEEEIQALGRRAAGRIAADAERNFIRPWAMAPSPALEEWLIARDRRSRAEWRAERWDLRLVARVPGDPVPVGMAALHAREFPRRREVTTASWLVPEARGRGLGLQMRAGVLVLAFDGLGAVRALTDAHEENAASRAVSRRLGYRETGRTESPDVALDGSLVPLVLSELQAADWRRPPGYGLSLPDEARARFGL